MVLHVVPVLNVSSVMTVQLASVSKVLWVIHSREDIACRMFARRRYHAKILASALVDVANVVAKVWSAVLELCAIHLLISAFAIRTLLEILIFSACHVSTMIFNEDKYNIRGDHFFFLVGDFEYYRIGKFL